MKRNDASGRKILVLTPQFPYPPQQGTALRNFNLIAGLARRHRVHLLSFGEAVGDRSPLHELCAHIWTVPAPQRSMRQRLQGLFFSHLPDMAHRLASAQFRARLTEICEQEQPEVVQVEGIELAPYLLHIAERRNPCFRPLLVFDDHNAEYLLQKRAFETDRHIPSRWVAAAYSWIQWRRLQRYERQVCLIADRVVVVSEHDAQALRRLVPELEPSVVPNGVDFSFYSAPVLPLSQPGPGPSDLVFTGKMDFRPNVDAVFWFVREVLPLIRRQAPEVRFWVIGKDPHPRLDPLRSDPAVKITGQVEDVRPYIAAAAVVVIPLRMGGGTRLKVLEAMAMGKAIVSTSLGCEGFDLSSGHELVIADSPAEFAAAVCSLLGEPARRQQLGEAARQFATRYDWQMIIPKLEQVYEL